VNDDEEHIRAVLAFIRPHNNVINYELLPYHRFGESKYGFLGRVYELEDSGPPAPETVGDFKEMVVPIALLIVRYRLWVRLASIARENYTRR
jgi:pyruvate formate lyase activating enzyme